jgi:hypothetical protein
MDEQKTEEVKQETAPETTQETEANNGDGNKPREFDKVERAEQAVKRMEDAEKRLDEKIAKLTELQADRLLGSTAGGHIEAKKEDPSDKAAAEIVNAFR